MRAQQVEGLCCESSFEASQLLCMYALSERSTSIVKVKALLGGLSTLLHFAEELSDYGVIEAEDRLFDSLMVPNQERRCKKPQKVVLTRKETLKLVNGQGVTGSKVSESPSCFSMCLRPRVMGKWTLEWLPRSLEVLEP